MSETPVRKRLLVKGIVQGVGFRDYTYRAAKEIGGLLGWVRNLDSGDVEVLVQGSPAKIEELIRRCRQGPSRARVDEVGVSEARAEPGLGIFEIRRE